MDLQAISRLEWEQDQKIEVSMVNKAVKVNSSSSNNRRI